MRPAGTPVSLDPVAGVAVFQPERALLLSLIQCLRDDGVEVLLHIDGPAGIAIEEGLLREIATLSGVTLLLSDANLGLGAALNRLAAEARQRDARRIILFDQDSSPTPGLVTQLGAVFSKLQSLGHRPAVLGPRPVSPEAVEGASPRYGRQPGQEAVAGLLPVRYVITSGSLVDLDAFAAVGPFRDDFWIDGIDTEWCFRAWSLGYSVWLAPDLAMPHRIGHGVLRFGRLTFPRQSLMRMSTYFRNQAFALRLPHVPSRFKLRLLAYLPLQAAVYLAASTDRGRALRVLGRALVDGWAGRLGAPRDGGPSQ